MTADLIVNYDSHLRSGRVWRVEVEVPSSDNLDDIPEDVPTTLNVAVDVISPTRDLAQYIVTTMYPSYISVCIDDEPFRPDNSHI